MKNSLWVVVAAVLSLATIPADAQGDRGSVFSPMLVGSSTTNYYFARSNELTITVDVLGYVQRPGRYEISKSLNLVNLLALAGGASTDGAMNEVRITRLVEIGDDITVSEHRVDLTEIANLPATKLALFPGDVVQVERTGWSTFREVFSTVVPIAIITSAVAQLIYFTKN